MQEYDERICNHIIAMIERLSARERKPAEAASPATPNKKWIVGEDDQETHIFDNEGKCVGYAESGSDAVLITDAHNATLQPQSDDTKRLDWLESNGCGLQLVLNSWKWRNKTFREAIDAAMRKET